MHRLALSAPRRIHQYSASSVSSLSHLLPARDDQQNATVDRRRFYSEVPKPRSESENTQGGLPTQSSVVVIGGGVIGASVLYHLTKAGVSDAVLLERADLTHGSTWHAAGLLAYYNPGANARDVHFNSMELYKNLGEEVDMDTGIHYVDSIRLIDSEERLKEAKVQMSKAKLWRADQELITPERIKELHPLVNTDGILAGIYNTGDGHGDPSSITNCLVAGARNRGGSVHRRCPVRALNQRPDGKWEVVSEKGTIIADKVVNCGGLWGDKIGKMAGINVPVVPILHQYVITGPIDDIVNLERDHGIKELPVLRDLYGSYYLRQERNGVLIGPYESKESMQLKWEDEGAPDTFGPELFEGDLDRILPHVEEAMVRLPCVADGGIKVVLNGPVSWAPDGNPLLGPVQGKKNFWNACAFSYGIVQAGGAGKYLVDWMMNDEPPYELTEWDTERYGDWASHDFVKEKVRETYGFNNLVVYPHEEREAGRPLKTPGIYGALKDAGCSFSSHNGWETPSWFAGEGKDAEYKPSFHHTNWFDVVRREVDGVCNNVGVYDASAFSKYNISGPKAEAFLNYLCANKLPKLGRSSIIHMLTPNGKMYAELTVTRTEEEKFYIVTGSEMERHDLRWFEKYLPRFEGGVEIENVTDSVGVLALVGPKSREVLSKLTDVDLSHSAFKFLDCKDMTIAGIPLQATRISYTGELGWELHHPLDSILPLYEALMDAGKAHDIINFGGFAQNSLRLEKGFRLLGSDMTKDHSAVEAGLVPRFVKVDKGDFVGREAVMRDMERADDKTLKSICLKVDTDDVQAECQGNEPVYHNGDLVGFTTSGSYGFTVGTSVALGYIPSGLTEPGTKVEVELMGQLCTATVAQEPLVDTEPVRTRKALKAAKLRAEAEAAKTA